VSESVSTGPGQPDRSGSRAAHRPGPAAAGEPREPPGEDWEGYPADAPDVVAVGGDLSVPTLVAAYRAGCFPWPVGGRAEALLLRARYPAPQRRRVRRRGPPGWLLPWFSPDPRAVLLPAEIHVSRSLRSRLRRSGWTTSADRAFGAVLAGCADRPDTWITPALARAYRALHEAGEAHSVEVWSTSGELIGGVYGVGVGGVFCAESMFHRASDASKVALLDLARRLTEAGGVLIDAQTPTEHLIGVGERLMRRDAFRAAVRALRDRPVRLATHRAPVGRLLGAATGTGAGRPVANGHDTSCC
jgi:leucyl/phenylalanyl-tRNA--protein transferase